MAFCKCLNCLWQLLHLLLVLARIHWEITRPLKESSEGLAICLATDPKQTVYASTEDRILDLCEVLPILINNRPWPHQAVRNVLIYNKPYTTCCTPINHCLESLRCFVFTWYGIVIWYVVYDSSVLEGTLNGLTSHLFLNAITCIMHGPLTTPPEPCTLPLPAPSSWHLLRTRTSLLCMSMHSASLVHRALPPFL